MLSILNQNITKFPLIFSGTVRKQQKEGEIVGSFKIFDEDRQQTEPVGRGKPINNNSTMHGTDMQLTNDDIDNENDHFKDKYDVNFEQVIEAGKAIFPDMGWLEYRPIPNVRGDAGAGKVCSAVRMSFDLTDKDVFERIAKQIARTYELVDANKISVYWGVVPRKTVVKKMDGKWIGGRIEDVAEKVTVAWIDQDDHGTATDAENLVKGTKNLETLCNRIGQRPRLVVKSGGGDGRHTYFRYTHPVDVEQALRINKKLATVAFGDMAVTEVARIMRIPGGWHTKGVPKMTTVIEINEENSIDPDKFETALDEMIAFLELDKPPNTVYVRRGQTVGNDRVRYPDILNYGVNVDTVDAIAQSVCERMAYYQSAEGTREIKYPAWLHMASWAHALTDDAELFEAWGTAYSKLHANGTPVRKWDETAGMAPISCSRAQSELYLKECVNCPILNTNMKNPATLIRNEIEKNVSLEKKLEISIESAQSLESLLAAYGNSIDFLIKKLFGGK